MPGMLEKEQRIDFAYIDGMHTFDYVLLDFFYVDKMLQPGGVVAFNDCGYRAVDRVLRFLKSHRRYEELAVGLPRDFRSGNPLGSVLRWATGRNGVDRYFLKRESWEPDYNFYRSF